MSAETATITTESNEPKKDKYCWLCHIEELAVETLIKCIECPRAYHSKCILTDDHTDNLEELTQSDWICHECQRLKAENLLQTTLKKVTEEQFYAMLNAAVKRLKYNASEPFQKEVDIELFPQYHSFVLHPMDISQIEKKIETKQYVSLEEIIQDTKWIVHNCTIFNGPQNKLTSVAKSLFKMIKHELSEIDVCPDCYLSSISKNNEQWFTEPCRTPHPLVFAKIKGFPYWPAKALKAIGTTELDVRFFGAHDRSIVPVDKCFWLSKEFPANVRNHTMVNMQPSIQELNTHIKNLETKFGEFKYAPSLMPIDLSEPFVFIETFKDINCLPIMSETSRVARKRTNNTIVSTTSASTLTPTQSTPKTTSIKAKPTPTDIKRRSVRNTITVKEDNEEARNEALILNEEELNKANTQLDSQTTVTNGDEEPTNTRSKRLRKLSSKYSNYAVETITSSNSTKRKSMTTRASQQTPEAIKKLRSDSESKSSTTSLILTKSIKTASISSTRSSTASTHESDNESQVRDDDDESTTSSSNDVDREKRKELKRKEKKLRKEKLKEAKFSDNEMDASFCSTTATTSSIIVKLPRYNLNNEDSSSVLLSSSANQQARSPIKIKISRNQDDKSKSSSFLIDSSNSQQQKQEQQQTASNTTDPNSKPIKLNLGELLFKCKKSLGLISPLQSPSTPPPAQPQTDNEMKENEKMEQSTDVDENNDPNESKASNQDEVKIVAAEIKLDLVEVVNQEQSTIEEEIPEEIKLKDTVEEVVPIEPAEEVAPIEPVEEVAPIKPVEEVASIEPVEKLVPLEPVEPSKETDIELENKPDDDQTPPEISEPIVLIETEDVKQSEPVIIIDTETDSPLEPGEIVRPQVAVAICSNGVSMIQASKRDLNSPVSQTTKFKKIAPAFPVHSPVEINKDNSKAKIVAVSNNFVSNLINTNTNNNLVMQTKREIELEKLIEDKNLKTREMKQFYEKLLCEMKQSHEQQQQQLIREIKYNCDLKISEVLKESSKKEMKLRADFERKLTESKMKQWCACCGKEAIYYCCWNTSYCDEECQKMHWGQHLKTCTRIVSDQYNSSSSSSANEQIINETHQTTITTNKYNENNYTSNGTSYNNLSTNHESQYVKNSNNLNDVNSYDYIKNNRQKQQQQQQAQRPIQHVRSNFSFQQLTNELQKKIPIPSNTNHSGFTNNNSNNNNNITNNSNSSSRKVPL